MTNKNGKPSDTTVSRIVADALEGEVGLIDTAPVYGDAESRLGALLPDDGDCAIVTKTVSRRHSTQFGKEDSRIVRDGFTASLDRLRRDAIYGLLVHAGSDLLEPGGERLVDTLREFQEAGLVQKIGVSIYDAEELDRILNVFKPEIVQLPLSVADQRLQQSGHLAVLKALGVEIHARSVFLQGVLLAEPTM
ncbi:MAG: aldo/keto reductase, partial [Pseudomonadota bacterium]|nr:aldo/keto reductase [Pseudomonadota bacterium]